MAMAVVYTPFSEISNGKNSWNIIAKVIRMWVVSDFVKHKIPFSLEMVLLDQEVSYSSRFDQYLFEMHNLHEF